jgi:hypothetical protein
VTDTCTRSFVFLLIPFLIVTLYAAWKSLTTLTVVYRAPGHSPELSPHVADQQSVWNLQLRRFLK